MSIRKLLSVLFILCVLTSIPALLSADELALASWNVRILSDGSRDDRELAHIAQIIDRYDLVAVQEVRDTRVLDRLLDILPGAWDYTASEPVGRGVKEIYAFFFRTDRVQLIRDVQTLEDRSDSFIREPAIASFISGSFDFTLVSIHVLFGNSKDERREEIAYLDDVMELVLQTDEGEHDIILVGDFNVHGQDHSWEMAGYRPLVDPDQKTTITDTSSYDNIWLSEEHTLDSEYLRFGEIYPFDELLFGDDDRQASLMVSDHRPISAWFSTDRDDDYHTDWGEVAYAFTPAGYTADQQEVPSFPDDRVYIAKVVTTPTEQESVHLYNPTDREIRLRGYTLGDKNRPDSLRFTTERIPPYTSLIITRSSLSFQINDRNEIIYLHDETGMLVDMWEDS
jgi:endonuclease/exonuclease/phosphatase family metal-dependent hydrolase